VEQREQFIADLHRGLYSMTELCERYSISRKTGYKWRDRHALEGLTGLQDRSHAPLSCPHRMAPEIALLVFWARHEHPYWGPRKLLGWLQPRCSEMDDWPAPSSVGNLLAREGLVTSRRRRRKHQHPGVVPPDTAEPNDLWTADFKGQFPTRDGVLCFPLTLADLHARYLLDCRGLPDVATEGAWITFDRAFREYGLPKAIRTDNGSPFCGRGLHGLCRLNVWWLRLGIQHQRIHPASPQENGAHERMHRTLKREACRPPRAHMAAQQRGFNAFRAEYNDERPHEALDDDTPSSRYHPSPRTYHGHLPPIEYPGHYVVKTLTHQGSMRFKDKVLFVSTALKLLPVGLEETDDGIWSLHFNHVLLGKIDERDMVLRG
jgi:transposase InsO family protein